MTFLILLVAAAFFAFGYVVADLRHGTRQTTWVYCPGCKQELVGSKNRVVYDTDLVRYYCGSCSIVSVWDFDFPVPILRDSYYRDPNDWMKRDESTPPVPPSGESTP